MGVGPKGSTMHLAPLPYPNPTHPYRFTFSATVMNVNGGALKRGTMVRKEGVDVAPLLLPLLLLLLGRGYIRVPATLRYHSALELSCYLIPSSKVNWRKLWCAGEALWDWSRGEGCSCCSRDGTWWLVGDG
ncbi:hypothetical protein E2C01_102338 [Portunus trituberculatus]|uniref:Uncharacterized protein n=1 Tax=Portunus trituberculatus TaxID=210409 RepID=A0A5B7KCW9_PORTR|nr:hypothetical protein [Portunus trituberculatus]